MSYGGFALRVALATAVAAITLQSTNAFALQPGCTQSGQTVTCSYKPVGNPNQFTVPAGITSLHVVAVGGHGDGTNSSTLNCTSLCGGRGAYVTGDIPATPGDVLQIVVGGDGVGTSGGVPDGGSGQCFGGGGSSSVYDSVGYFVDAGGGGGDGCAGYGVSPADPETAGGDAGSGGGGGSGRDGGGGQPGTLSGPGAGGTSSHSNLVGGDGAGHQGGYGAAGESFKSAVAGGGGGGGGGLYGAGGGGGGDAADSSPFFYAGSGGAGGGGSSLVPPGGSFSLDSTRRTGVVISYTVPSSPSGGGSGGSGGPAGGGTPGSSSSPTMSLGAVIPTAAGVSVNLACHGAAGATCRFSAQLSTLEKLLGAKLLAVSARKRRHSTRVTVGSATFSLATGQSGRMAVPLNTTGKRLLRRFGKLPVTLTVTLLSTTPQRILRTTTTIRTPHKRPRRHH